MDLSRFETIWLKFPTPATTSEAGAWAYAAHTVIAHRVIKEFIFTGPQYIAIAVNTAEKPYRFAVPAAARPTP
jgi:hypothetical protein